MNKRTYVQISLTDYAKQIITVERYFGLKSGQIGLDFVLDFRW